MVCPNSSESNVHLILIWRYSFCGSVLQAVLNMVHDRSTCAVQNLFEGKIYSAGRYRCRCTIFRMEHVTVCLKNICQLLYALNVCCFPMPEITFPGHRGKCQIISSPQVVSFTPQFEHILSKQSHVKFLRQRKKYNIFFFFYFFCIKVARK